MKYWNKGDKTEEFVYNNSEVKRKLDESSTRMLFKKLLRWVVINDNISMIEFAAGVGRITKNVFQKLKFIKSIDLLEPAIAFKTKLEEIKKSNNKIENIFMMTGEKFVFKKKYDIIFGQYFLENISDFELLSFLIKARDNLTPNGKIIFRENVVQHMYIIRDTTQMHQRVRSIDIFNFFFKIAGLTVVNESIPENKIPIDTDYTFYEIVLKKENFA